MIPPPDWWHRSNRDKHRTAVKSRGFLFLLLLLFFLLGSVYSLVTPVFEAPDEVWHYAYVRYLAEERALPALTDDASGAYQEVAQPPLYYAVAALVSGLVPDDDLPELMWHNPGFGYQAGGTVNDNKNMLIHTEREQFPWRGAVLAIRLARFVSLAFGLLTVWAAWGLGQEAFPQKPALALGVAAVVAFHPQFLFISSVTSNDSAAAALSTAALWAIARAANRGITLPPQHRHRPADRTGRPDQDQHPAPPPPRHRSPDIRQPPISTLHSPISNLHLLFRFNRRRMVVPPQRHPLRRPLWLSGTRGYPLGADGARLPRHPRSRDAQALPFLLGRLRLGARRTFGVGLPGAGEHLGRQPDRVGPGADNAPHPRSRADPPAGCGLVAVGLCRPPPMDAPGGGPPRPAALPRHRRLCRAPRRRLGLAAPTTYYASRFTFYVSRFTLCAHLSGYPQPPHPLDDHPPRLCPSPVALPRRGRRDGRRRGADLWRRRPSPGRRTGSPLRLAWRRSWPSAPAGKRQPL